MKKYIIPVIAVVALVLASIPFIQGFLAGFQHQSFGATTAGNMLAENYIPYVLYNGGYNSAKDISTSAFLGGTGTFQFGSSGTTFTRINTGQCYFAPGQATTISATTTKQVDCQATAAVGASGESALTGVTSGDNTIVTLSTTTASNSIGVGGLQLSGCTASSTQGYISCSLYNGTGATYTWPILGNASGTASYIVTK